MVGDDINTGAAGLCPNCQGPLALSDQVCPKCKTPVAARAAVTQGGPLSRSLGAAPPTVYGNAAGPSVATHIPRQSAGGSPHFLRSSIGPVLVGVLILAAIGGVIALAANHSSSGSKSKTSSTSDGGNSSSSNTIVLNSDRSNACAFLTKSEAAKVVGRSLDFSAGGLAVADAGSCAYYPTSTLHTHNTQVSFWILPAPATDALGTTINSGHYGNLPPGAPKLQSSVTGVGEAATSVTVKDSSNVVETVLFVHQGSMVVVVDVQSPDGVSNPSMEKSVASLIVAHIPGTNPGH